MIIAPAPLALPLQTGLTGNARKHEVFSRDADFLRSLDLMRGRWAPDGSLSDRLWNVASILIRPEAFAARRAARILVALREHHLTPVAVRQVWVSAEQTDLLWRYQANVATPERQDLLRRVMTAGPSLYVVLADGTIRTSAPATVHVTYLKGSSIAAKRRRHHLRRIAGPAIANTLTYLHASDDPADFVREMAVFFDRPRQVELLAEIEAWEDRTVDALRLVAQLESRWPGDLLEPGESPDGSSDAAASHLRAQWAAIVRGALRCRSFVSGETYDTRLALVPDDKRLSLPLDAQLVSRDFGAPA